MQAQASRNNGQSPQQRTAAPPQPPDAEGLTSAHDHDPSWCLKHQVTMRWHDGNARGPGWFSHQLADGSYLTGCTFSREHTLLSLALVEVQNKGRVWCRQKNVRQAGVTMATKCA